ncbi:MULTISPECIES: ABC transporter family substrate-binding protein [Bacteria]
MRIARALGLSGAVATLSLTLTGCIGGGTILPSDGPTPPPPPSELPATAWTRADAASVSEGGDLHLAVTSFPLTFNTYLASGIEADTRSIVAPTTGGPLIIDEYGVAELDEDYASSVEVTSRDPLVVEIELNPSAVWEDGTPITVADYEATWRALNGVDDTYRPASTVGYEDIASVQAGADEFDVLVTFSRPFVDWESLLTGVVKESIASDPAVFNEGFDAIGMPSSGPFVFTEIDSDAQVVILERNPLWWGETPKLDRILFKAVSQDQQGSSFANGEVDALYISSNADLYETAQTVDGADIQATNGLTWTHVTMNAKEGPLSDVNVRKAVASIVNREQISAAANTPVGVPAVTQGDYIFMAGQEGYEDAALPYDTEAGAAFLEEAGYSKDGDSWVKDGEPLELSVTVPADTATNIQRAEQVQADLGEFGIPVELVSVPVAGYFSDYVIPGDFEMVSFSWVGTAFPISSSEPLFYPLDSEQNFTATTDEALGDLWDQANAELDPEARIEIANEINETIWGYVPMFPIAPLPNVWAVQDGLVNYGATQFETIDWTLVGWAAE